MEQHEGQGPIFRDGEAYERFMGQWSRLVGRQFLVWLSPAPGGHWLDVGCGTGAFTQVILDYGSPTALVAVDPAEAQLDFARHCFANQQVQFRVADALDLPFPDHEFNVAVSALVLNFVHDQRRMVSEMRRVVRPGGIVGLYVWDFAGRQAVAQHIAAAIGARDAVAAQRAAAGQQFETTRSEYMVALLEEVGGFARIDSRAIEITVRFENFTDYWSANTGFASPVGQFVATLSGEDREAFMADVGQRVPLLADGSIAYVAAANAVKGVVAA